MPTYRGRTLDEALARAEAGGMFDATGDCQECQSVPAYVKLTFTSESRNGSATTHRALCSACAAVAVGRVAYVLKEFSGAELAQWLRSTRPDPTPAAAAALASGGAADESGVVECRVCKRPIALDEACLGEADKSTGYRLLFTCRECAP